MSDTNRAPDYKSEEQSDDSTDGVRPEVAAQEAASRDSAVPADTVDDGPENTLPEVEVGDAAELEEAHRQLLERLASGTSQLMGGMNADALAETFAGYTFAPEDPDSFTGAGQNGSTSEQDPDGVSVTQHLEEITTDLLSLRRQMREMERQQQEMVARLAELQQGIASGSHSTARELDGLRRDLLGERKHTAITGVSNELIPLVDRLRLMRQSLDQDEDARTISQLGAVVESLGSALRRLGCEEFDFQPGVAFDPTWMQCEGYVDEADPGTVAAVVRPGYRVGQAVLRPAGVTIGLQQAVPAQTLSSGKGNNER